MLFGSTCAVCGRAGVELCTRCVGSLPPAGAVPAPPPLDDVRALLRYEAGARELIAKLKYGNRKPLAAWAGSALAVLAPPHVDCVTWAPTTRVHADRRGFDQAELLARMVARRLRRPARALLRRRPGPAQTGAGRLERLRAPRFAPQRRAPARVLLIDDVVTTGATLAAAAAALRAGGALTVNALVVAATP